VPSAADILAENTRDAQEDGGGLPNRSGYASIGYADLCDRSRVAPSPATLLGPEAAHPVGPTFGRAAAHLSPLSLEG
jgi:hypothetical protein